MGKACNKQYIGFVHFSIATFSPMYRTTLFESVLANAGIQSIYIENLALTQQFKLKIHQCR